MKCDLHDYVEIACLYNYKLELTLKDGTLLNAIAIDTKTSNKQEFILLKNAQMMGGNRVWVTQEKRSTEIPLDSLVKIKVLSPNAKFDDITF